MVQVIDDTDNRPRGFLQNLMASTAQSAPKGIEALAQRLNQLRLLQTQQPEKPNPSIKALGALDDLENLVSQPGIGFLARLNPSAKARFNRGVFEATTSQILPFFKELFPRGFTEKEFKYINDTYIPQSGDSEAKIRGKITALKRLMGSSNPQEAVFQQDAKSERKEKRKSLAEIFG